MLLLFGKSSPIVKVIVGVLAVVAAAFLHTILLGIMGGVMVVWGGTSLRKARRRGGELSR